MDTKEAIAHLVAAGYKVSKPSEEANHPVFVCSKGHGHKSQEAMLNCDRPKSPRSKREAKDYVTAYRMRQEGQTFSAIGKHFGLTATRGRQLALNAERVAKAKAKGGPNWGGLYGEIYDLI